MTTEELQALDLRVKKVIKRFKTLKPACERDALLDCRVSLKHLDSGEYRNVYLVDDLPVVAKFPATDERFNCPDECLGHAQREFRSYRKIRREFPALKKYLPKMLYSDMSTGVCLMPLYDRIDDSDVQSADELALAVQVETGVIPDDWDPHTGNVARDVNGQLVLLDLGCLGHL